MDLDAILRCPRCRGPLVHAADAYECAACRLRYRTDPVPDFIAADAQPMTDSDPEDRG